MSDGSVYWTTTRVETPAPCDVAAARTVQALEGLGFRIIDGHRAEKPSRRLALPVIHDWTVTVSRHGAGGSVVEIRHGLRATTATWWCCAAALVLAIALIFAGPFTDLGAGVVLVLLAAGVIDLTLTRMRLEAAFGQAVAAWAGQGGITTSVSEVT